MSGQENSDQGQERREQGQENSDQEQEDSDQEQEDSDQDQDMSDQGNSEDVEDRDETADDDLCVVCGLGEDKDNEEGELWVECTMCLNWTHIKCVPENYAHSHSDEDFLCPMCTCGKRRKSFK